MACITRKNRDQLAAASFSTGGGNGGKGGGKRRRSGAALVLVLTVVVLVLIAAIGFVASIGVERQAAAAFSRGAEARMLADSVVNLVMGQIRQASEQEGVVWTSQPGLLRTFSAQGEKGQVYKLYSSGAPIVDGATFAPADDLPANWKQSPASYVDLNHPVVARYNKQSVTNYPILDPEASGKMEGFSIANAPDGVAMPVAWLYLLKDGSLAGANGMTEANPPVARIAYWTDDETCKLNVNTASEGVFWDVPRTGSEDDRRMALNQPAQREYQAYPGHPATTSLSPVLWSYFHDKESGMTRNNGDATTKRFPEALYSMLPRYSGEGSRGGTVGLSSATAPPISMKAAPLLASVDELVFLPPGSGDEGRFVNPLIDRKTVEQGKFFLTAHSRTPETNLFNRPRVTVWPIASGTSNDERTPYDKLISFASTINGKGYYFTRQNSQSTTVDLDPSKSARNVKLYEYLQDLTGSPVPGFGGTFATKYGADRNQLLTEIFDYVRCVNLHDSSSGNRSFKTFTRSTWADVKPADTTLGIPLGPGVGQVAPIIPTTGPAAGTRGFGRFHTISRAVLTIIAKDTKDSNGNITDEELEAALFFEYFTPAFGHMSYIPDYTVSVTTLAPFHVASDSNPTEDPVLVSFSGSTENLMYPSLPGSLNAGGYDGFAPQTSMTVLKTAKDRILARTAAPGSNSPLAYPFISMPFKISKDAQTPKLKLKGGTVRVTLSARDPANSVDQPVQTLDFAFPPQEILLAYPTSNMRVGMVDTVSGEKEKPGFEGRFGVRESFAYGINSKHGLSDHWIRSGDIARSLESTGVGGDLRLSMGRGLSENSSSFAPIDGYLDPVQRRYAALGSVREAVAEDLFSGLQPPPEPSPDAQNRPIPFWHFRETTGNLGFGRLVKDAKSEDLGSRARVTTALVPPTINGVTNIDGGAGDFDTGNGSSPNGPLINKSDDGNSPDGTGKTPYMEDVHYAVPLGATFSSPSRQMPSAVMLGSLPTGVKAGHPWQTLLFNPVPATLYGTPSVAHRGAGSPPDHLLLDLFHVPVVEPYSISEPFSTAGKVNMNYQIIPFTGIERKTALHGVLQAVQLTAISDAVKETAPLRGAHYKRSNRSGTNPWHFRYPLNIAETLKQFDSRFQGGKVFLSSSEICEIPLIPDPSPSITPVPGATQARARPWTNAVTLANLDAFWKAHPVTGDNVREQPYTVLYPRLTTRSNTYTVHVMVQTLQKVPSTSKTEWIEDRDKVTGEFRGSFLIERYLNPSTPSIPDFASGEEGNLNQFYRFRVVSSREFNP